MQNNNQTLKYVLYQKYEIISPWLVYWTLDGEWKMCLFWKGKDWKILGFYLIVQKAVVYKGDGNTKDWCSPWNCWQKLKKKIGDIEIWRRINTIQTAALIRSPRRVWKVMKTQGDILTIRLKGKITF